MSQLDLLLISLGVGTFVTALTALVLVVIFKPEQPLFPQIQKSSLSVFGFLLNLALGVLVVAIMSLGWVLFFLGTFGVYLGRFLAWDFLHLKSFVMHPVKSWQEQFSRPYLQMLGQAFEGFTANGS